MIEPTISLGQLILIIVQAPILFGVVKVVRFVNIQKDFPPHRHINGSVLYPAGYEPGPPQVLAKGNGH